MAELPNRGTSALVLLVALLRHLSVTKVTAMALMPRPPGAKRSTAATTEAAPLRRCTFRRVTAVPAGGRELPQYEVACTFPDRKRAVPLGDVEDARPICSACTYQGIFRADSD